MGAIARPRPLSDGRLRVLVADATRMGGQLIAASLRRSRYRFDVQAVSADSSEACRALERQRPDVAVISAELPDGRLTGFRVLHQLRATASGTAGVMLLNSNEPELIVDSFRFGARGVFCRDASFKALPKCILSVRQGQVWISNSQLEFLLEVLVKFKPMQLIKTGGMRFLTQREQQITNLVAEGLRNKEISLKLNVSEHTVKNYIFRIFEKLGLSTRVELALYALSETEILSGQVLPSSIGGGGQSGGK